MIPVKLQLISLGVGGFLFALVIYSFVRLRLLHIRYAMLWLSTSFLILLMCIQPGLLFWITAKLSIQEPIHALYFIAILFLILNLLGLTVAMAIQSEKIKSLTQTQALLKHKLDRSQAKPGAK